MPETKKHRQVGAFVSSLDLRRLFRHSRRQPTVDWHRLPKLLSLRTTAELLGVHPNTLRDWDRQRVLTAVRIGTRRDRRYYKTAVQSLWLQRQAQTSTIKIERRHIPAWAMGFAVVVFVIGFSWSNVGAQAEEAPTKLTYTASECRGWTDAGNARTIDLPSGSNLSRFTSENSAVFSGATGLVQGSLDQEGIVVGGFDTAASDLVCDGYAVRGRNTEAEFGSARLRASFSSVTELNNADTILIEASLNGKDWETISAVPAAQPPSRYLEEAIPLIRTFAQLDQLSIRARLDQESFDPTTEIRMDGLEVIANVLQAKPVDEGNVRRLENDLDPLVAFSQDTYRTTEQPVITVPKTKVNKFLWFKTSQERWTLKDLVVIDNDGGKIEVDYRGIDIKRGDDTFSDLRIDTADLHPGKYTVQVTMAANDGTLITTEEELLWGVVALNVTRAVAQPGDEQLISMGVLDDAGHTICNADLVLTITDPKGAKQTLSTEAGSIESNPECVDKGVTNDPDYSAKLRIEQNGIYQLHLEARTDFGERVLDDNFQVDAGVLFDVQRVQYPTRIYPPAMYPVRIAVTPREDYFGLVRERVPKNFEIMEVAPGALIYPDPDHPDDIHIVEWEVDWKAGETYFLAYTFDAPDISPALFLTGPFSVGGSFLEAPLFQEPRQWQIASDAVTPDGRVFYGDSTNSGVLKFQTNSFDFTFNGEVSTGIATSSSLLKWVVARPAPTRDEVIVGHLKADGRLDIIKGVNGYDVNTDYAAAWNHAFVSGAQTCEGTTTAELATTDCTRPFDIAYERLSGRAMVVYAGDSQDGGTVVDNQKLFYCYWDGTSWGPVSNCAPTTGSNDITLSSNGRPTAVSIKTKGGSNEILMGVGIDVAGTHEVEAYRWTGSTWTDQVVATDTTDASNKGLEKGMVFDVEWESNSGDALVIYATADTSSEVKYKVLPSGGSWGSETGAFDTNANGSLVYYLNAEGDPQSNRIAVAVNDSANDFSGAVWKADGSTSGWTVTHTDNTLEGSNGTASAPQYTDVAWEAFSSAFVYALVDAGAGNQGDYIRVACNGSGCSETDAQATINMTAATDDNNSIRLAPARNSNDIMVLLSSIDRELVAQHWNGSAWETDGALLESAISSSASDRNSTYTFADLPFTFTYIPYSAWQRNWRFFDDETVDNPSTGLNGAAENATPTGVDAEEFIRLRVNVAELSGMGQTDARKKLQYTSGCNPNTSETACTWADVGDTSETSAVWRYATAGETCAGCADGSTSTTSRLTGTNQGSPSVFYVSDKDAAADADFDHTALLIREIDFPLKAEDVAASTTYYFRLYDNDQLKPVRREQDNDGANDCASATCTYPSLTTASAGITVSGGCFTDATEGTPCTDDGANEIKVAINGVLDGGSDTTVDGSWSFSTSSTPSNGAILTFFINGEATESEEATTVVKYDGSGDVDLVKMYQSHLVIGTDTGSANTDQTITNTDLATTGNGYENSDDEDVTYSAVSGTLIVDDDANKTETLYIIAGDTFRPDSAGGDTVTTHHLYFEGTYTTDNNQTNVAGDFTNAGTFTASTGTLTLNGSTAQTFTTNAATYNAVTLNNTGTDGANDNVTISGNLDVNGAFNVTNGDLVLTSGNPNVNTAGHVTIGSSAFVTKGSGTWTFDGDLTYTDSTSTKQDLGAVVVGTSPDTTTLASDFAASSLTINAGDVLNTKGYEVDLGGTFTCVSTCTLDMTDTAGEGDGTIFTFTGNWDVQSATATITPSTTSTVRPDGATDQTITTQGKAFYNFYIDNSGTPGDDDIIMVGTFDVDGALTVNNGNLDLDTNDPTIDVEGNIVINGSGSLTASDVGTFTAAGSWDNNGAFTHKSGTVTFDASDADNTVEAGSSSFYNLILQGGDGSGLWTFQTDDATVEETLDVDTSDELVIASGRTVSHTGATLTLDGTISGAGTLRITDTSGGPGTSGTLSSVVRYDASAASIASTTFDARTYGGRLELYQDSTTAANRTVTPVTDGTYTVSSHFYLINDDAAQTLTLAGASASAIFTISGDLDYTGVGASSEIIQSGNDVWTVAGNVDFTGGTYTATAGNELKMTGTANLVGASQSLYKLTIDGTNTTVTAQTSSLTVTNVLTIGGAADSNNDTLSLNGVNLTSSTTGTVTFVASGTDTISGTGTLIVHNSNLDTDGMLSANVQFVATNGDITAPARAYGAQVSFSSTNAAVRTITLGGGTFTVTNGWVMDGSGDIGGGGLVINGTTNNPTVSIGGSLAGADNTGSEVVTLNMGSGTWTISGSFDLTLVPTFSMTGTLVMDGNGTLTTTGDPLANLSLTPSGTVTLANETITVTGNLVLGGAGSVSAGSSTVVMTGSSKTIDGGGKTLNNLTIDPSTSTITLQNTDLTVSATLNVATGETLSLNASRTLTLSGTSGTTLTLSGTISGSGRLTYQNTATAFPATGTISSILRMDATGGDQTIGGTNSATRTFGGQVEIYSNSSGSARTVTLENGTARTFTFSSNLYLIADNTQNVTLTGDTTTDPTVNVTGDIDFTGTGGGSEILVSGNGTWTVAGNINFTDGTYTATSGNTIAMTGASKVVTAAGNALHHLTTSNTISVGGTSLTLNGNMTISSSTFTGPTGTFEIKGNWSNSGNYTHSSGLVKFSGSSTQTLTTNNVLSASCAGSAVTQTSGKQFYDVEFASSGSTVALASNHDLGVDDDLTISSGTFDIGDNANQIYLKGDWDMSTVAGSAFNARHTTSAACPQLIMVGASANQYIKIQSGQTMNVNSLGIGDISATERTYYLSSVGGSAATLNFDDYIIILSGTLDTKDGSNNAVNLTRTGQGDMYVGDDFGEHTATTKIFNANSSTISINTLIISDGQSSNSKPATFNAMTSTITLAGPLTVGNASQATRDDNTFDASTASTNAVQVSAIDLRVGDIQATSNRPWTLTSTSSSAWTMFANTTFNATGSTSTYTNAGGLVIDAGCTFNAGSTTYLQNGTTQTLIDSDVDLTLNNLTIDDTGSRNVIFRDADTSGRRISIAGTFTWDQTVAANAANIILGTSTFSLTLALDNATVANSSVSIPTGKTLTLTASSTLELAGNFTNAGTLTENTGKILMDGTNSSTINTGCTDVTSCTTTNLYNLEINKTGAADVDDNVTVTTNGIRLTNTLTITDGEMVQGANNIRAEGSSAVSIASTGKWTNISTGDLTLGGTFTSAGTAIFNSNNGAQCVDGANDIVINSTVADTTRLWTNTGTLVLYNVEADDMTNSSITAYTSDLSDPQTTWVAGACGISVSGTVYTNAANETTAYNCSSDNLTIYAATNGDTTPDVGTCSAGDGTFTITGVTAPSSAGDPIVLFIDSTETPDATTVTLAADTSSNITGVVMIQDRVVVTHQNAGPITNAKLATGDNGDTDIHYAVSAGNLTVDSNFELHVMTGKTYTPGGTVTTQGTGDFHLDDSATATIDTATSDIARDITVDGSATLNINANLLVRGGDITTVGTGAIATTAGTPTTTIRGTGTVGGGSGSVTFYNLTIGDGTTATTALASDATVSTLLTVGTGSQLTINLAKTLSAPGSEVSNGGTITGAGTLRFTDTSGGPGTGGTLSSIVRYDASAASIASTTFDARTYGGRVELYQDASTAANRTITPATDGTYTLSGASSHLYLINDDAAQTLTLAGSSASAIFDIGGDLDFTGSGASSEIIESGNDLWTVAGNVDFTGGTYTATAGNELKMTGTKNLIGNGQSLYKLTIDGANTTVTVTTSNVTVTNVLTIGGAADSNDDTLSIGSSRTVTSTSTGTVTFVASGTDTISGAGTLIVMNSNLDTDGTLSADVYFDANTANLTAPARTYGGDVTYSNNHATAGRTITLGAGTHTISGNVILTCDGSLGASLTVAGNTNNPPVNISGSLSGLDLAGFETETLNLGSNTWTVSGSIDLTFIPTVNHNSGTVLMDGTGTLTTSGKTLNNLTINSAGTVTLAGETHTLVGNLILGGSGTPTVTGSTVSMTGSTKTIDGGGKTLNNLTIGGSTTTLQNTDLTVSGTLTINASQTLSINASRTLTHTGATLTWGNGSSTIAGAGTLQFTDVSGGPSTGGVISAITRYDASAANIASTTFDARTYSGRVELYADSGTAKTISCADASTYILSGASSHLHLYAEGAGNVSLLCDTATDPTITIGGDLDYLGTDSGSEAITSGAGTWTVSGNVNFTGGTYTATAGNTLFMNGTGTLTSNGQNLDNLTINTAGTVTLASATHTIVGNLLLGTSGSLVSTGSSILMAGASKFIEGGDKTLVNLTIGNGTTTLQTSSLTVTGTLVIAASQTLSINSGITLTHTGATLSWGNGSSTISGAGRLVFTDASGGPGTGGTLSSITRFHAVDADIASTTLDARTYGGLVEIYIEDITSRTATMASGTYNFSSHLYLMNMASEITPDLTLIGATNNPTVNITGDLDFTGTGDGPEIITSGTGVWTVGGNVNFTNGTYTATSGNTLALNGGSQQTLTTASNALHHLTITNASGSDPDSSPSIIFADGWTTNGTFTAATANTKLRFLAGGTYAPSAINLNGQATGTRVFLRSSVPGTTFAFNAGGGSRTVSNTAIKDSNACGSTGGSIDASDGTNRDDGNSPCWFVNSLSITLSGNSINLGTLSSTQVNQGSITNTITTNAATGYISLVKYDQVLTSGGNSIGNAAGGTIAAGQNEFGASSSQSGNAIGVWSPTSCTTTGTTSNATALSTSFQSFASSGSAVSAQGTTLCLLSSVTGSQAPGSYQSTLTIVTTARF